MGIALRDDQEEIASHAARFKVLCCGRRWGKTTLALWLAIEAARSGANVWWVVPTLGVAFKPWLRLLSLTPDREKKLEKERFILFSSGGSVIIKSADDPDTLRGDGIDLLIIDEAAFIRAGVWVSVLRPALADTGGKAVIISTPNGKNWFYESYVRGLDPLVEDWQAWHYATIDNPIIPQSEIDDVRAITPERDFRQEYLAEFIDSAGDVFAEVERVATAPAKAKPIPGRRYVAGIDFARHYDFTCVVILDAETKSMVAMDRFNQMRWGAARRRIAKLLRRWNVSKAIAESNAMGEPNIEALRDKGLPVVGFTTTTKSKPPLIEDLVLALEDGELRIQPDPVLLSELKAFSYEVTSSGRVRYEASTGHHDDTVIALSLAWRAIGASDIYGLAIAVV